MAYQAGADPALFRRWSAEPQRMSGAARDTRRYPDLEHREPRLTRVPLNQQVLQVRSDLERARAADQLTRPGRVLARHLVQRQFARLAAQVDGAVRTDAEVRVQAAADVVQLVRPHGGVQGRGPAQGGMGRQARPRSAP
ncbi:hypothetical protein [Deinococcus sonorensis]|uniref:Uncharacterized protein n=2 Tax=Deinococcus sonorensis TaxID=309891 RepID=A0AAU7U777_9DEIO